MLPFFRKGAKMLEVGKNSYVTVQEATEYITAHYSEKNALRAHWAACSDEYKETYLLKSLQEIEALPFVGRKTVWTNTLQFPRSLLNAPLYVRRNPVYILYNRSDSKIPQEVKAAQIENALGIIRTEYKPTSKAVVLAALGVIPSETQECEKLSSKKAETLLAPFLGVIKA